MTGLQSLPCLINNENALFFNPLVLGRMETSRNYRRRAPGFVHVNWRSLDAGSIPSPSPLSLQPPQQLQIDPGWIPPLGPGSSQEPGAGEPGELLQGSEVPGSLKFLVHNASCVSSCHKVAIVACATGEHLSP